MSRRVNHERTIADLLGGEEEPPRRRLTRHMIEDETLSLIDEAGLEAATMRAVADRLAVTPRALYRHIADKQDLLRGVAGRILGQVRLPPASLPWRRRLQAVMVELHRVMADHPHAAPVFARPASSAPDAVVAITDSVVGALQEAGVGGQAAVRTFYAMFSYTLGFVILGAGSSTEERLPAMDAFVGVDPAALPHAVEVAPFLRQFAERGLFASQEQFRFGLDLMLDSVARGRVTERRQR